VNSPAGAAGTWKLGDLTVNRLGFGAMRLTGSLPYAHGVPSDRQQAIAVLRRAAELGVNHIDTAAFYFSPLRSANELIAAALAPYPDDLVIVTKVGPGRYPWGEWYSARPDQLRGQVEENLRQLGRDHLDVVNLRRTGQESVAEHFAIAGDRRQAGGSGTDSPELLAVAHRHGATPAQVRLAWTLHQGPHVLAIPGTGNPAHLAENVAAAALRLTPGDLALLGSS
jgi:aryl-alcohol dehydrogenase-like predicted oxidoreductase